MAYDVTQDPQYQEQSDIYNRQQEADISNLNQQLSDTQLSYADQRQQTIRSYQDALDQIQNSLRMTGIRVQGDYVNRGLYNPSGEVSGIGQGYAANVLNPIYQTLSKTSTRRAEDLASLGQREQSAISGLRRQISQVPLSYEQQRLNLKNRILAGIQEAQAKADESSPRALQLKERREQQAKGREYLSTPAAATRARKQGRTVIKIGSDLFALGPIEEIQQQQRLKNFNKAPGGDGPGPTTKLGSVVQEKNAAGGLSFFRKNKDGSRTPISIIDFATQQGKDIRDILAQSEDRRDKYARDYIDELYKEGKTDDEVAEALYKVRPWWF